MNLNNLKDLIEKTDDTVTLDYPFFIPTCHNRKPSIIDYLDDFLDSEIYLFIYENETGLYEYVNRKNITKVAVPVEYLSIQKMRVFMQKYAKQHNIQKHWVCDDDLKSVKLLNKKCEVSVAKGAKILEDFSKEINFGIIGFAFCEARARFWEGQLFNLNCPVYNLILVDENTLPLYTGDTNIHEDTELLINCIMNNIPVIQCQWGLSVQYSIRGRSNSIASSNHNQLVLNDYLRHGDFLRLAYHKKKDKIEFTTRLNVKKIQTKNIEYNQDLVDAIHQNDYDKICEIIDRRK